MKSVVYIQNKRWEKVRIKKDIIKYKWDRGHFNHVNQEVKDDVSQSRLEQVESADNSQNEQKIPKWYITLLVTKKESKQGSSTTKGSCISSIAKQEIKSTTYD
jgi:hypothetical protein